MANPTTPSPSRACSLGTYDYSSHRRHRWLLLLLLLALLVGCALAQADRFLLFSTSSSTIGDMAAAEVRADDTVIIRLRAARPDTLEGKADLIARRLTDLALAGLRPDQLAVEKIAGQWALTGAGRLIVMADEETVQAAGLSARSLCESWRERLAGLLRDPYLTIDPPDMLLVPLGEARSLRFGGTVTTTPSVAIGGTEVASARLEPGTRRVVITGRSTGTTVLTISVGKATKTLTISVKRWAARLVPEARVRVSNRELDGPMAEVAAVNAVLDAIHAEIGATVHIDNKVRTPAGYEVALHVGGPDFIPVAGKVNVTFVGGLPPIATPATLLLSNYPEKISGVGALMRQQLPTDGAARLLWHHKNYAGEPLVLAVRLINAGAREAALRVSWAKAGPDSDEIFVGFNAMRRYWEGVMQQWGVELHLPPGSIFETVRMPVGVGDVVSGLMNIATDDGEDLYVEVTGRDPHDEPAGFLRVRTTGDPLPVTPFEFPAVIDEQLAYEVGGRFGHLSIGREEVVNEQGIALDGAYGVLHRIRISMSNPLETPARTEIAVRAGGGVARIVALLDGKLVATHLLRAGQEEVLAKYDLPPRVQRTVGLQLIPTAGSNLPFTVVVRGRER